MSTPTAARRLWQADVPAGTLAFAWLGQAGFALRTENCRWLIDPYLSDSLAQKYRGTDFPHERMMAAPFRPEEATELDWVFCTHRHSDHMDPGTLPAIAATNPRCRFAVPRAEREPAIKAGIPRGRMVPIDAGESIALAPGLHAAAIASAHEDIRRNDRGECHFLGFVFRAPAGTIYHSGDCVPYPGLVEAVAAHRPDVALLPVNGRDAERTRRGFPGNLTFAEARRLCAEAGATWLVPHHFGMFAFNTPGPAEIEAGCRAPFNGRCLAPALERYFILTRSGPGPALRRDGEADAKR